MDLSSKIILVVGAASGIGRAAAELCRARGATVIGADIDAAAGQAVTQACGIPFFQVDVTDPVSVQAMYARIAAEYGRLDVLLHTAGILQGAFVSLDDFSPETFRRVLDVNTTGSFLCAKYGVPLMRRAGRGVIVLVSSGAATGGSSSFAYGTSKGGVNSLAVVLTNALAAEDIRVNVVSPGNIDTAMKRSVIAADVERSGQPGDLDQAVRGANLGDPLGVARILAWLASDEADYVRGGITTR
jgi:NAD(P)-dependent dehydrogenase (short-subunit alcohol dehydrogenase family)